ncbi:M14 family metallopeptidase [Sutcliffiella deserti]|uniref:M14 family metallopeptidase n=1 Tax=Sutcliffiella deserti TaxID=2875501 RepID=UPI001CC14219|nr:M14 family metallopeptidase [Sutcliffiella deserti]
MIKQEQYFKPNYEESRAVFRSHLEKIQEKWPNASLSSEKIGNETEDNTIDVIYSDALESNQQVLFFTTGEHGIEGYAGAAVTHLFVEEYLDRIDPQTTGICLIHALNPWGMRNFRRVNENNVDLNRNYLYNPESVSKEVNENYAKAQELFLPNGKITDIIKEKTKLYSQLTSEIMEQSYNAISEAKGMGQYEFERGVYYGGLKEEESTQFLKTVQKKLLTTFSRVIHMDWHTALGPTNEITMVASETDTRAEEELKSRYPLKNIQKFSPDKVKGDSTNHFHKLKKEEHPDTYLFSALFEFGTFGEDREAERRTYTTIILENQLYWEGAEKEEDKQWVLDEFQAMFYPKEREWRDSVLTEAQKAFEAILKVEGILN